MEKTEKTTIRSRRGVGRGVLVLGAALLLGGLVVAKANKKAREVQRLVTAGPGYIQKDFFDRFEAALEKRVGKFRAEMLFGELKRSRLPVKDVMKLINGRMPEENFREWFGDDDKKVTAEITGALREAVAGKDRRLFFGMLLYVMIEDFSLDPTAPFVRQVMGAREAVVAKAFRGLVEGDHGDGRVDEVFLFEKEQDRKFMRDILKRVWQRPFFTHPMATSLEPGGVDAERRFEGKRFPRLEEGMPGTGDAFAKGMAGDFVFDKELPPCPYTGAKVDEFFERK